MGGFSRTRRDPKGYHDLIDNELADKRYFLR